MEEIIVLFIPKILLPRRQALLDIFALLTTITTKAMKKSTRSGSEVDAPR
jgi:hypothetical protein